MIELYLPIAVVILSNILYHICAKQTPSCIDPFASLTVTYLIGAMASALLYFITNKGGNIFSECKSMNWVTVVLGIVIVGLEVGNIYMYKVGWQINTGQVICSTVLTVALVFVGYYLYNEAVSFSKVVGILLCITGVFLINK